MYNHSCALASVLLGLPGTGHHLPTTVRMTLAILTAHMHEETTSTYVSASTISRIRNVGERSIRRHLDILTGEGLLRKTRRPGTSTVYEVTFPVTPMAVTLSIPTLIPPARRRKQSMSEATVQFAVAVYRALEQQGRTVYAKDVAEVLRCSAEEARRALKVAKIAPAHGLSKAETVLSRHPRNRTLVTQDKIGQFAENRTLATVELSNRELGIEEEPDGSSSRRERRVDTPGDSPERVEASPGSDGMVLSPISVREGGAVEQLFTRNRVADDDDVRSRSKSSPARGAKAVRDWSAMESAEEFRLRYVQRHGFCHINVRRLAMILGRNRKLQGMDARHEMKIYERWVGSKYAEGDGDPVARYLASFPYHRFEVEQEIAAEDPSYVSVTHRNREERIEQANEELTKAQDELMDYYKEVFGA